MCTNEGVTSAHINDLITFYQDNLPTPSSIDTEHHCWTVKWKRTPDEANKIDTPQKVLASTDSDFFPNIKQIFFIASTLSVTSAECERSVSRLHDLLTWHNAGRTS